MLHDKDAGAGEIPMRPLGRTGLKVSALGVGGHHLGDFKTVEELESQPREILRQIQRTGRPVVVTVKGKP